jgi:hypothetical protein
MTVGGKGCFAVTAQTWDRERVLSLDDSYTAKGEPNS